MISFLKARTQRILHAFRYSWQGFGFALRQKPFQEELIACAVLVPVALWLELDVIRKLLLIGSLVGVLFAELVNTAIEATVDRMGPERHPLSGMAKDIGSAAVLLCILWAIIVWAVILWTR